MIATAVKISPLQSAGELIRNVENSPTKEIDATLRQSVVHLVRKERREINTVLLEGVSADKTVGYWRSHLMLYGSVMRSASTWRGNVWMFSKFTSSRGR